MVVFVKGGEGMEEELDFHCIVQHFVTFYEQAKADIVADFGKPCAKCKKVENCDWDWLTKVRPIIEKTGVKLKCSK